MCICQAVSVSAGVLEPLQAGPVIIEDNCFIGARSEVVEGRRHRRGFGVVDGRVH